MAIIRGVERTQNSVQIIKRVQFFDECRIHQFDIEAKRTSYAQGMAQPIHLILFIGQPE